MRSATVAKSTHKRYHGALMNQQEHSMSDAPYFERHVFFCMNKREDGRNSCGDHGAEAAQKHCKRRIKELDMNGAGKIRINQAGCMDRCEEGPLLVIYPEATWYTYVDTSDIDEIIDTHLVGGKIVDRLKI